MSTQNPAGWVPIHTLHPTTRDDIHTHLLEHHPLFEDAPRGMYHPEDITDVKGNFDDGIPMVQTGHSDPKKLFDPNRSVSDSAVENYTKMPGRTAPPVLIANGKLLEGGHRLKAAINRGDKTISHVDISGLVNGNLQKFLDDDSDHGVPTAHSMGVHINGLMSESDRKLLDDQRAPWRTNLSEPSPEMSKWHESAHPSLKNEDGTPKTLYHGTRLQNVTSFKPDWLGVHLGAHPNQAANRLLDQSDAVRGEQLHYYKDRTVRPGRDSEAGGGHVFPVYTNIKNPLEVRDLGIWEPWRVLEELSTPLFTDPKPNHIFTAEERSSFVNDAFRAHKDLESKFEKRSNGSIKDLPQFLEQRTHLEKQLTRGVQDAIKARLAERGHDGLVYDNEFESTHLKQGRKRSYGLGGNIKSVGKSYIIFDPKNIKSIFNEHPTDAPELHLSESLPHFQTLTKPNYEDHFDDSWPTDPNHSRGITLNPNMGRLVSGTFEHNGHKWFGKRNDRDEAYREELAARAGHMLGMGEMFTPTSTIGKKMSVNAAWEPHHRSLMEFDDEGREILSKMSNHDKGRAAIFDWIMGNGDRHEGNIGVDTRNPTKPLLFDHDNLFDSEEYSGVYLGDGNVFHRNLEEHHGKEPLTQELLEPFVNKKADISRLIQDFATRHGDKYALESHDLHSKPYAFENRYRPVIQAHKDAVAGKPWTWRQFADHVLDVNNLTNDALYLHESWEEVQDDDLRTRQPWGSTIRPVFEKHWKPYPEVANYDDHFKDWPSPEHLNSQIGGDYTWTPHNGTANQNHFVHDPTDPSRAYVVKVHRYGSATAGGLAEEFAGRVAHHMGLGQHVPPVRIAHNHMTDNPHGISQSLMVPGREWVDDDVENEDLSNLNHHTMGKLALFDYLLGNGDRHESNLMIDQDRSHPWFIDHSHIGNAPLNQTTYGYRTWKNRVTNDEPMYLPHEHQPIRDFVSPEDLKKIRELGPLTSQFSHKQSAHFPNLFDQRAEFMDLYMGDKFKDFLHALQQQTYNYDDYRKALYLGAKPDGKFWEYWKH